MKRLAIIPARSGSKRLPDKNIKLLKEKPLIAYTIEAAIGSCCFDEVMVSTDSTLYSFIAKKWGASVPFLRSDINSQDSSSTWSVVKEVLEKYEEQGKHFDEFAILQPTSPLRTKDDIINAFALMEEKKANAIVSVYRLEEKTSLINTLTEDLNMKSFSLEAKPLYKLNGAIYIANAEYYLKNKSIYNENCFAYIMDKETSIDIDTDNDFVNVENVLNSFDNLKDF